MVLPKLSFHFGAQKTDSGYVIWGTTKVLFVFDNKVEVDRVLQSEPWTFDKHLVVMEI